MVGRGVYWFFRIVQKGGFWVVTWLMSVLRMYGMVVLVDMHISWWSVYFLAIDFLCEV